MAPLAAPARPLRAGRIGVVQDLDGIDGAAAAWNSLAAVCQTSTVFQTYEWHRACADALDPDAEPLILIAEDGDGLNGVAALKTSARRLLGGRRRIVEFLGFPGADYCDVLARPGDLETVNRLVEPLIDGSVEWDILRLANVPQESTALSQLRARFDAAGFVTEMEVLCEAPTCLFTDPAIDRELPRKKSLRRHWNHFAREGALEVRHYTTAADIEPWLPRFFDQHVRRRALTDVPSLFTKPEGTSLARAIVRRVAPTGRLLFSIVLFNESPIAFHLGFLDRDRLIWYLPTFEIDEIKHSPGEVLLKALLEYALERGVREFDFGLGMEPYKHRFSNHVRKLCVLQVFRTPGLARAHNLLLDAKSFVRRSDTLTRLGRRALHSIGLAGLSGLP